MICERRAMTSRTLKSLVDYSFNDSNSSLNHSMNSSSNTDEAGPGYVEVDVEELTKSETGVNLSDEYGDDSVEDPDYQNNSEDISSDDSSEGEISTKDAPTASKNRKKTCLNKKNDRNSEENFGSIQTTKIREVGDSEMHFSELIVGNLKNPEGICHDSSLLLIRENDINEKSDDMKSDIDIDHKSLNVGTSVGATKRHFCVFCKKLFTKFARHLELRHAAEDDVMLFLSFPKKSLQRKKIISALRKRGDYLYNSNSQFNLGDLIVVRRPQAKKQRKGNHYLPCGNCGGMYSVLSLNIHHRICLKRKEKSKKDVLISSRSRMFMNLKANSIMRNKILPIMRNDEISRLVQNEDLIILFGNRLSQKYRSPHLYKMIRARLRCVGKFYWCFKKIRSDVQCFEDVFDPRNYDNVINAINDLAGLDEEAGQYKAPATASNICTYLKKISLYLISEMIKQKNKTRQEEVRNFLQLLEDGLPYEIYKTVTENQLEIKRNKTADLPSTKDINLLQIYLEKQIRFHYEILNRKFSVVSWKELASALLISLQVFNRRRAGEIERIKIKDFMQHETVDSNDEMAGKLETDSSQNYARFLIRGKRGRGVPVLIEIFKLKCLQLILKNREEANVPTTNPYLFGISGKDNMQHLEATRLMNRYAHSCGAKNPQSLKGTNLRKHFATKCGTMDLNGVDIKDIADYMGHHEKIHLEHYRLPNATRDIVRMSRLLEKAQGVENSETTSDYIVDSAEDSDRSVLHRGESLDKFTTPDRSIKRMSWSNEEKCVVDKVAKFYLENFESPTIDYCSSLIENQPVLTHRTPSALKAHIMNEIKKRKETLIRPNKKKCNRGVKKFWSVEEKQKIFEIFRDEIEEKRLPSLATCKHAIEENTIFRERTAAMMKSFISNILKKKKTCI